MGDNEKLKAVQANRVVVVFVCFFLKNNFDNYFYEDFGVTFNW